MKNDGGSAFPTTAAMRCGPGTGMSLRDWFAGQALASMAHEQNTGDPAANAKCAYEVADAMLAEREKKG